MSEQKDHQSVDDFLHSGPLAQQLDRERTDIVATVAAIPERTWELQSARILGAIAQRRKLAVRRWRMSAAAAVVAAMLVAWPLYRMIPGTAPDAAAAKPAAAASAPATVPAVSDLLEEPWQEEPLSDYAAVIDWESWLDEDSRKGES